MSFDSFIKCGCNLSRDKNNKKIISGLPKDWLHSTISIYNNEKNYMILCGKINNISVIDLDFPKNNETSSIEWFESKFGKIADINTLVTSTINQGFHIYFSYNNTLKTTTKFNNIPLDILNDNRGVLEGENYTIINNSPIRSLTDSELLHFSIPQKESENLEMTIKQEDISKNFITRVLDGLSVLRFNSYDDWLRLGFFLSQFTFGKELFDFYSKKSEKFNQSDNDSRWDSLSKTVVCDNKITIATLMYWLKDDNNTLFSIINKESRIISEINRITKEQNITANEIICIDKATINLLCDYEKALIPLHDVSSKRCSNCQMKGIISKDGFVLKCNNCSFFYPELPIQIEKTNSPTIYNIINQVNVYEDIKNKDTLPVAEILKPLLNIIYHKSQQWYKLNDSNGIYEQISAEEIINEINLTIVKLKDSQNEEWYSWISKINYKKMLIEELKALCYNKEEFDLNPNLLGFQNGVLDLTSFEFRNGKRDEFITMKCKYNYDIDLDTKLAEKLLKDYFPIQEDFQYVLDLLSLCLEGRNRTQQFIICYGFSASNGKSFLMERLFNIFNEYSNTFPVNMITSKMRDAGNANVDLINFKNKRFMYSSEPEANCKFNTNLLKQLTGDTITARKNYSNEIEKIKPTYNLFICCNRLPELDLYDEGIARRIGIIEFKNTFIDNPNKKNKYEKQRKKYEEEELVLIEKSLLQLIINNFNILKTKKFILIEPDYLKLLKKSYGESNNNIKEILDDYFESSENNDDYVTKKEIKDILKQNKVKINNVDLIRTIECIYGCQYYDDTFLQTNRVKAVFRKLKLI
jgi:P4 family phage/plasmid primase-like protien